MRNWKNILKMRSVLNLETIRKNSEYIFKFQFFGKNVENIKKFGNNGNFEDTLKKI